MTIGKYRVLYKLLKLIMRIKYKVKLSKFTKYAYIILLFCKTTIFVIISTVTLWMKFFTVQRRTPTRKSIKKYVFIIAHVLF